MRPWSECSVSLTMLVKVGIYTSVNILLTMLELFSAPVAKRFQAHDGRSGPAHSRSWAHCGRHGLKGDTDSFYIICNFSE